jgi:hypothetical protein
MRSLYHINLFFASCPGVPQPLWSLSETEQATVKQAEAAASFTKAQTAQIYIDMGALDPSEVRKGLADDSEFEIEKLLDDLPETS